MTARNDKLVDRLTSAILECRSTSRALMTASRDETFKELSAQDDAAMDTVMSLLGEIRRALP